MTPLECKGPVAPNRHDKGRDDRAAEQQPATPFPSATLRRTVCRLTLGQRREPELPMRWRIARGIGRLVHRLLHTRMPHEASVPCTVVSAPDATPHICRIRKVA